MRKCIGRRLVNIEPFSETETSVFGGNFIRPIKYYLIFKITANHERHYVSNIFKYKLLTILLLDTFVISTL